MSDIRGTRLKDIPNGAILKRADITPESARKILYYMCVRPSSGSEEPRVMRMDNFEVLTSRLWMDVPFHILGATITIHDPQATSTQAEAQ